MNHVKIALAAIMLGTFILMSNVSGADQYQDYEMADGNRISFRITSEGMLVEDRTITKSKTVTKDNAPTLQNWVNIYELPESGRMIDFPLSQEEIKAARIDVKKKPDRNDAIGIASAQKAAGVENTVIEMADGNSAMFMKDNEKIFNDIGSWLTNLFKGNDL